MARITTFRDLIAYQRALEASKVIFESTKSLPRIEDFALRDLIRRSSRSVSAQLAEGWSARRHKRLFRYRCLLALGEAHETQAWLDHALTCGYLDAATHQGLNNEWQEIGALIQAMINRADSFASRR
jgi:four helix bundle protein